jgi:hypothetical protein
MNTTPFGYLAALSNGPKLPLQVLKSRAGFYIGTCTNDGPYSRESVEYWATESQAALALVENSWTQRPNC